MVQLFRHPSYCDDNRMTLCLCVCVFEMRDRSLTLSMFKPVCPYVCLSLTVSRFQRMSLRIYMSQCVCVANCYMVYSIFLWCFCLEPSLCCSNAQRSLCNWSGPLKPPCHMDQSSLGCWSVCLSIHQFLLIAQSQDSVLWLSIEWFLNRLNTLICNKVWDISKSLTMRMTR